MTIPIQGFQRNEKAIEDEWHRQQNSRSGDTISLQSNFPLLFLKEGTTLLRILPAYSEAGQWFREAREHAGVDPTGKFLGTFSCPEQQGESCPFCDEGRRLYELGGEENVEASREYRPRSYYYFNALVYNSPTADENLSKGVVVLKTGVTIKRELLDYDHDAANGYGDITNITNGFDIRIIRKGKSRFNTEYSIRVNPQRASAVDKLKEAGIDASTLTLYNLDEVAVTLDTEKVQELYSHMKSTPGFEVPVTTNHEAKIPASPIISNTPNIQPPAPPTKGA